MSTKRLYISGPMRENPSDLDLSGDRAEARLEIPSVSQSLSDAISGAVKYSAFDITLINNDGKFDVMGINNFLNSPITLKKSVKKYPEYNDFKNIRYGLVERFSIDNRSISIKAADRFRAFDDPACNKVTARPLITKDGIVGKDFAYIYGQCTIPLAECGADDIYTWYLTGENVANVQLVSDEEGNTTDVIFDSTQKTLRVPKDFKAKSALVTGSASNRIGQVIVDLLLRMGEYPYIETNYDIVETNIYLNNSPFVNFTITGGSIKSVLEELLKSDMAFLIQLNDGRLTFRQWGHIYDTHYIGGKMITQQPRKTNDVAVNNYFSECIITYGYNFSTKEHDDEYYFDENKSASVEISTKFRQSIFGTYLTTRAAALALAEKLSGRFSFLKDRFEISVGVDTSGVKLLDYINIKININGRSYSDSNIFAVVGIDNAQDKLVLEVI